MQETDQINYRSHTQEQCATVKNNNRLTHFLNFKIKQNPFHMTYI